MFHNALMPLKAIHLIDGYIRETENDTPSIPNDIYKFIYLFYNDSTLISIITDNKRLNTLNTINYHNNRDLQPSIGIDLGCTYSCIATTNKYGKSQIISNNLGQRTIPSHVTYTNNNILVGTSSKTKQWNENTIFDIKKLIGKNYNHPIIQSNMNKNWPFKIIKEEKLNDKYPMIEVEYKGQKQRFLPHEICAEILKHLKSISERHIGKTLENVVLTIPSYFDHKQRLLTKQAAQIAGLNCLRIIKDSIAACIAYNLDKTTNNNDEHKNVLVFHLGGSTLNVSVVHIDDGIFEILSQYYDMNLGGNIFDIILTQFFLKQFCKKNKSSLNEYDIIQNNKKTMCRLIIQCERIKHLLSTSNRAILDIDSFYNDIDFVWLITRPKFENLCRKYFKKCINYISTVLNNANLIKSDINGVVLSGGSMRIPRLQQMINEYFIDNDNDDMILYKSINPEEVIAFGASIQAAILSGYEDENVLFCLDITPLSLGIKTLNGIMTKLIPRNSIIPCKITEIFTTFISNKNDNSIPIEIYVGENIFVKQNELLNKFELNNVKFGDNIMPQIEITFDLDSNSFLNVTVNDINNVINKNQISIDNNRYDRMTEEEIRKIVEDAEKVDNNKQSLDPLIDEID
eukprot:225143_1